MKNIRKIACHGIAVFLALAVMAGDAMTASAAGTADLDMDRTGSIRLTLEDGNGNVVSGGEVTLYQVADLYLDDGNMAYAYTSAFAGCTSVLDVEDNSLAAELAAYAAENSISGTTVSIGADGKISFSNLVFGLYLVAQTTASDNYETINPFVVTVPMEENGAWVYEVDASPKVGAVTLTETETDTPETDTPETDALETDTTTAETPTTEIIVEILPQTGQLNWPIPVFAIAGMLLLIVGWRLNRSDEKRKKYYAA